MTYSEKQRIEDAARNVRLAKTELESAGSEIVSCQETLTFVHDSVRAAERKLQNAQQRHCQAKLNFSTAQARYDRVAHDLVDHPEA
jgi:chromosome segregation ATPase